MKGMNSAAPTVRGVRGRDHAGALRVQLEVLLRDAREMGRGCDLLDSSGWSPHLSLDFSNGGERGLDCEI